MVVSISRSSKIFEPQITDEINKAFASINDKIAAYKSLPLEYKEDVTTFQNTNSFLAGNILSIRESINVTKNLDNFETMKTLDVNVPYEVWCNAITENNENLMCYIYNGEIKLRGILSYYPQTVYVFTDIVTPNN